MPLEACFSFKRNRNKGKCYATTSKCIVPPHILTENRRKRFLKKASSFSNMLKNKHERSQKPKPNETISTREMRMEIRAKEERMESVENPLTMMTIHHFEGLRLRRWKLAGKRIGMSRN